MGLICNHVYIVTFVHEIYKFLLLLTLNMMKFTYLRRSWRIRYDVAGVPAPPAHARLLRAQNNSTP